MNSRFALFLLIWSALLVTDLACRQGPRGPREHGELVFLRSCASCHRPDARGGPLPGLVTPPRDLTDRAFQASVSDEQLARVVRTGKGQMPPFGAMLSDDELAHLILFLRSLPARTSKPE